MEKLINEPQFMLVATGVATILFFLITFSAMMAKFYRRCGADEARGGTARVARRPVPRARRRWQAWRGESAERWPVQPGRRRVDRVERSAATATARRRQGRALGRHSLRAHGSSIGTNVSLCKP